MPLLSTRGIPGIDSAQNPYNASPGVYGDTFQAINAKVQGSPMASAVPLALAAARRKGISNRFTNAAASLLNSAPGTRQHHNALATLGGTHPRNLIRMVARSGMGSYLDKRNRGFVTRMGSSLPQLAAWREYGPASYMQSVGKRRNLGLDDFVGGIPGWMWNQYNKATNIGYQGTLNDSVIAQQESMRPQRASPLAAIAEFLRGNVPVELGQILRDIVSNFGAPTTQR